MRRADLDHAIRGPRFVGLVGRRLAQQALVGDVAALDQFHELIGLALPGVTEHAEGDAVRLIAGRVGEGFAFDENPHRGRQRVAFRATNQCGHDCTCIDAAELVTWILSADGRTALARRGIPTPAVAESGVVRSGRPPRRARLRETVDVVAVDELLNSPDPRSDPALPAWIRAAIQAGQIEIRRRVDPAAPTEVAVSIRWPVATLAKTGDLIMRSQGDKMWTQTAQSFDLAFEVVESAAETPTQDPSP